MKCLFVLISALQLRAGIPTQIQVRAVTFEKSGAATSLEAAAPGCDEPLFVALMTDTAAGRVKIVQDQVVVVRSGQRSKADSQREFPQNTEADGRPLEWFQYPTSFNWHNLGQHLEVEATVSDRTPEGWPGRRIAVILEPGCLALLAMEPWPVPDLRGSGQMGHVLRPVSATHKLRTEVYAWTGGTILRSVAPSPQAA